MRWRYKYGNGAAKKTSKTSLKTLSEKALHSMGRLFVSHFFKSSTMGRYFKELLLPLHSLPPFPKHDKQSLVKGGVDFLSLSTSLHPTPPFYVPPPTTWLKSPPSSSACFGQSLRAVTWEGFEPSCRYCSSFQISIMSLVADVHMCCPCVYPERWTLFWFRYLSVSSFKFGLSSEVRARRKPHIWLIVWFVVSILMRWNPSCRIFCIARIVRQWEDGGAIWREFSYWMEPQQLPIGCHII